MSCRTGSIEIECDAPPYPVVRASREVGLRCPEDVRWCQLRHFTRQRPGWRLLLNPRAWKPLLHGRWPREGACSCGQQLPLLRCYAFTFRTGEEDVYYLGQCGRCRTVFWEPA